MSYDRNQVAEAAARARDRRAQEQIPQLRVVQAQAVVMEKLLTDFDHWNKYLSYLQNVRNNVQSSRDSAQQKQNDPAIWDPHQMAKLKSDILRADSMLETLDFVMSLPKALIEDGEKAKDLIQTFEKSHGTAEQPESKDA